MSLGISFRAAIPSTHAYGETSRQRTQFSERRPAALPAAVTPTAELKRHKRDLPIFPVGAWSCSGAGQASAGIDSQESVYSAELACMPFLATTNCPSAPAGLQWRVCEVHAELVEETCQIIRGNLGVVWPKKCGTTANSRPIAGKRTYLDTISALARLRGTGAQGNSGEGILTMYRMRGQVLSTGRHEGTNWRRYLH